MQLVHLFMHRTVAYLNPAETAPAKVVACTIHGNV